MPNDENELANEVSKHYESLIEEVESLIRVITFEMRAPLTTIVGYADYLLSGELETLKDKQQQAVNHVRMNAKKLFDIINFSTDELMLLNLLHGHIKPSLERMEIQELLGNATSQFAEIIESKNQQLVIDVPEAQYTRSDYYCCEKIFSYLIDNACKYTKRGGQITVTSRLRSENILITISDNGIGISKGEQEHIFDNGFRGSHEVVEQAGGLGRGLYNAKRLAKVLECEMGVKSEVGKGSTFWFTLPLATDEEE